MTKCKNCGCKTSIEGSNSAITRQVGGKHYKGKIQPIELIVDTLVFTGFLQGKYTVDVSEIIKPALFLNIIADARDTNLEPSFFSSVEGPEEMNPEDFMELMKTLRPEEYDALTREVPQEQMVASEPLPIPPLEEEVGFIGKEI